MNSITIGYSTRKHDPAHDEYLKKSCGLINTEVIAIENKNKYSLSEAYNLILSASKNDIVVFIHDDITFDTKNWGRKLIKHYKRNSNYGIIGIAGTNQLTSGKWWEIKEAMHGVVNHSDGKQIWTSRFSADQGNKIKPMATLDGLFFSIDKTKIINIFDEKFKGFHFYDMAFVFKNFVDGVKVGLCTDIRVTHMSVGEVNDEWGLNKKQFEEMYGWYLPCEINEFGSIKIPEINEKERLGQHQSTDAAT